MITLTGKELKSRKKKLRKQKTKSETLFLQRLVKHGVAFKFQEVLGFYIVDFVIPSRMLIIEIDGECHNETKEYDAKRSRWLEKFGFSILRIKNEDVGEFPISSIIEVPLKDGYISAMTRANRSRTAILKEKIPFTGECFTAVIEKHRVIMHRRVVSEKVLPTLSLKKRPIVVKKKDGRTLEIS